MRFIPLFNKTTFAMKKFILFTFVIVHSFFNYPAAFSQTDRHLVFTAYQNFISRLYVLEDDGSVLQYHEYVNYRLQDMTVIDNEVYVTDAFIPCVYHVDIYTGDLELVVHDLWLFYFYGLAWDGTYFYVDEWDLNRYDMEGEKDGMADFDEDVMGSTFANNFYWMLNDENEIKCWDFSGWPELVEMPEQGFSPPTPNCRGLWYDGEHLWTAESIEGSPGKIYVFDFEGEIAEQWTAPAFQGWAACRVEAPVLVTEVQQEKAQLHVHPNPVIDFVDITLYLEKPSEIIIQLYDLTGNLVDEKRQGLHSAGRQKIRWAFDLQPGTGSYILRVIAGSSEFRRKIIIH